MAAAAGVIESGGTIYGVRVEKVGGKNRFMVYQRLHYTRDEFIIQLLERKDENCGEITVKYGIMKAVIKQWEDIKSVLPAKHSCFIYSIVGNYAIESDAVYLMHTIHVRVGGDPKEEVKKLIMRWKLLVYGDWINGYSFQSSLFGFAFNVSDSVEMSNLRPKDHWVTLNPVLKGLYPFVDARMVIPIAPNFYAVYNEEKVFTTIDINLTLDTYPDPNQYINMILYLLEPYRKFLRVPFRKEIIYVSSSKFKRQIISGLSVKIYDPRQLVVRRPIWASPIDYVNHLRNRKEGPTSDIYLCHDKKRIAVFKKWSEIIVSPDFFREGFEISTKSIKYVFGRSRVCEWHTLKRTAEAIDDIVYDLIKSWRVFIVFEYVGESINVELEGLRLKVSHKERPSSITIGLLEYPGIEQLGRIVGVHLPKYQLMSPTKVSVSYESALV
ncbi:MAG: hypothetical protein Hyperionvirus1_51 [Hyperionvirus sp.]|uniref:Uncharacterized protein n=1 Tax=Hyperionvirus sp. TaxID=2487770 RepID=A0A3G5A621_9VIRU|nr:MAG: hypothetical protein Hyperionvirus1_51 [Hyperionvirus sp.]